MNSINRSIRSKVLNSKFFFSPINTVNSQFYLENNCRLNLIKMSTDTSLNVEHDPATLKFFIKLGKDEAKLEYAKNGDVLNLWHTEVPPELQGKGIAKLLAKEAFDYSVKNNLKMLLTCTYLQKYYKENPKEEYKRLMV